MQLWQSLNFLLAAEDVKAYPPRKERKYVKQAGWSSQIIAEQSHIFALSVPQKEGGGGGGG